MNKVLAILLKTKEALDKTYYPGVIAAGAGASPNPDKPPFYIFLLIISVIVC